MRAPLDITINADAACLVDVVNTIGDEEFGSRLLAFVYRTCGAEYCTVLHLSTDIAWKVAAAGLDGSDVVHRQVALYLQDQRWQHDPMIAQARQQLVVQPASIVRTAIRELADANFRDLLYGRADICDRLLLCGRSATGIIGLSLLRSSRTGAFSRKDVAHVHEAAPMLMAIAGKHVGLICHGPDLSAALTSLDQIESCVETTLAPLSRREKEVSARILYGMSSIGIALELGISEETVMTYRKRAYQRLGIASQRELLLWYLDLWSARHLPRSHRVH